MSQLKVFINLPTHSGDTQNSSYLRPQSFTQILYILLRINHIPIGVIHKKKSNSDIKLLIRSIFITWESTHSIAAGAPRLKSELSVVRLCSSSLHEITTL